jgi:hypothetical protein
MNGLTPVSIAVPDALTPIVDLAAVPGPGGGTASAWLVLSAGGVLSAWQPDTGEVVARARLTFDQLPLPDAAQTQAGPERHEPWPRLHASRCGTWAAVVQDHGQHGVVVETAGGAPVLILDGGDYNAWTVPFALAFSEHRGTPIVIHRSDWNRLDVTDLTTGRLLTARELPDRSVADHDPEHDLDYFHGALHLSPDGTRVYDDGWVWQPLGVPTVWSVDAWLDGNVFESEDGPTIVHNPDMEEWNEPLVWIRDDRLAHHDVGDPTRPAGVYILDPTATEPGYRGHPKIKIVATLPDLGAGPYFTDGEHLLIVGEAGLRAYGIDSGEELFLLEEFRPGHQDPHTGTLIEIDGATARVWTPASWTPRAA